MSLTPSSPGLNDSAGVLAKGGNQPDTGQIFAPSAIESLGETPFEIQGTLVPVASGDVAATTSSSASSAAVESMSSFNSWWNDDPGVNMSKTTTLTFA